MINVDEIFNGFVLDHIQAGRSMAIYNYLNLDIIKDGKLIEKRELKLPKKIVNVLHCKNPRCITSIEQELEHVFVLTDKENGTYSCQYCEEKQGKLWEKL